MAKARVYIPATYAMLAELEETGSLTARSGWGFMVTPALQEFYTEGDEEEIAYSAFLEASMASMRLWPSAMKRSSRTAAWSSQ